jgi:hypothetical protein
MCGLGTNTYKNIKELTIAVSVENILKSMLFRTFRISKNEKNKTNLKKNLKKYT